MSSILKILYKVCLTVAKFCPNVPCKMTIEKSERIIKNTEYVEKELFDKNQLCKSLETDEKIDLSIIVPVYNAERYLKKCILTLCRQCTKYEYEIIAIDDGSTDSSLQMLNELEKEYSCLRIYHQSNSGISATRNLGINISRGKYIAFVDNDDYVSEGYIDELLARAYEKNADIVKCNYLEYFGEKDKFGKKVSHKDESISGVMGSKVIEYTGYMWGACYKKELWNNIRFPEGYRYEDMIMRILLMRKSRQFEYLNKDLYYYNIHVSNASRTLWTKNNIKSFDQFYLLKNIVLYAEKIGIKKDESLYRSMLIELGAMLWSRTGKLKKVYKKAIFLQACNFVNDYIPQYYNAKSNAESLLLKAFNNKNFILWNLSSLMIKLEQKLQIQY